MGNFKEESVGVLFDSAKTEYTHEQDRSALIDSKVNIALPIIAAFFLAVAGQCAFFKISGLPTSNFGEFLQGGSLFLLYSISVIFSGLATAWMVRAIYPRNYQAINSMHFYNEALLKEEPNVIKIEVIRYFIEANATNKDRNDLRMKLYSKGWLWAAISAGAFVFYIILYNIIMKGA